MRRRASHLATCLSHVMVSLMLSTGVIGAFAGRVLRDGNTAIFASMEPRHFAKSVLKSSRPVRESRVDQREGEMLDRLTRQ